MRLSVHGRVGSGRVGNGCRVDPRLAGGGLRAVPPAKPLVVDTDRVQLDLYRQHTHRHFLDYRCRLRRGRLLHSLLCLALPAQAGQPGGLRAGKPQAGIAAGIGNSRRCRRHACARPFRLEPVHHRAQRCRTGGGCQPAVVMEFSAAWRGRKTRPLGDA